MYIPCKYTGHAAEVWESGLHFLSHRKIINKAPHTDYFAYKWLYFYQSTSKKECKSPGIFKDWAQIVLLCDDALIQNTAALIMIKKRTNKKHTVENSDLCKAFCTNNDLGALYLRVTEKQTAFSARGKGMMLT